MRVSGGRGMPVFHKWSITCALGGLALVALAILAGAIPLSAGRQAGAADAGTALDFNGSNQYVTFGTALGSRNGTTVASPTWVAGNPFPSPPPINNALQFNGSSQYVTFGAAPTLGAPNFTLETWFNWTGGGVTTSTGSGGLENATAAIPLVTNGRAEAEGSNVDMNYFLGISGGKLAADFEEGPGGPGPLGQNHPVIGNATVTTNAWHHAAATYDGGTWRLYLDGVLDKTLAVTGNPTPRSDSIQHAALGSALNSTGVAAGFFAGTLDEARIWNIARAQSAIQATMNSELISPTGGLIGRWGMNEGAGTFVGDSTSGLWAQTFTIETWFKREGAGVATNTSGMTGGGLLTAVPLLTKGRGEADSGTNVDTNYFLGIDVTTPSAPRLAADYEEGSGQTAPSQNHGLIGGATNTDNVWHPAAATFYGATFKVYLDGSPDGT